MECIILVDFIEGRVGSFLVVLTVLVDCFPCLGHWIKMGVTAARKVSVFNRLEGRGQYVKDGCNRNPCRFMHRLTPSPQSKKGIRLLPSDNQKFKSTWRNPNSFQSENGTSLSNEGVKICSGGKRIDQDAKKRSPTTGGAGTSQKSQLKICQYWLTGNCVHGDKCTSCSGRSSTNENGYGSVVEEAASVSHDSSICGSMDTTDEGCAPSTDIHMSTKKALRAAMLKSRFADIIFKANTLLELGDIGDPVKLRCEKDKLEKQNHEEKSRIEAQIVAAEAASRLRAQSERKMQRERERKAARLALEQMERTVDFVDNLKFLRDLELMSRDRSSSEYRCNLFGGRRKPLERLGLYFKLDYMQDDDDDVEVAPAQIEEYEEGEIVD